MTPEEHRTGRVRLLAMIDQEIAECEDIADHQFLTDNERGNLNCQLIMKCQLREQLEKVLTESQP